MSQTILNKSLNEQLQTRNSVPEPYVFRGQYEAIIILYYIRKLYVWPKVVLLTLNLRSFCLNNLFQYIILFLAQMKTFLYISLFLVLIFFSFILQFGFLSTWWLFLKLKLVYITVKINN